MAPVSTAHRARAHTPEDDAHPVLVPTAGGSGPGGGGARPRRQRNPRGQGARLREEIIAGAAALLERTGSEETISMRAVALEIGVAPPSVARHFHDAAEIIDAVVAQELADFQAAMTTAVAAEEGAAAKLYAATRAYLAFGQAHPNRYRVIFERRFVPLWEDDDRQMELTVPLMAPTFAVVADLVQACIDTGESASTDAQMSALTLWMAIHGLVALPQAIPSWPWPDADDVLVACVEKLTGVAAPA